MEGGRKIHGWWSRLRREVESGRHLPRKGVRRLVLGLEAADALVDRPKRLTDHTEDLRSTEMHGDAVRSREMR